MLTFPHDRLPAQELEPGDLWVHLGQGPSELFPPGLIRLKGDAYAAKKVAADTRCVVLLEIRASGYALRDAQRNGGQFLIGALPLDVVKVADFITTGFVSGQGVMIGHLKNRHGAPTPPPFMHYSRNSNLLWELLEPECLTTKPQ